MRIIKFPNTIKEIRTTTFYSCTSLEIENLSLPSLESLGQNAFYGVSIKKISNLGKITALPTASNSTQNFGNKDVLEEVVLPDTVTIIPSHSFRDYTRLRFVWDSSKVTSVGDYAFQNTLLSGHLNLPSCTNTSFSDAAFENTQIESVFSNVYRMVRSMGSGCFNNCTKLAKGIFPKLVEAIGWSFAGCTALDELMFGKDCTNIGWRTVNSSPLTYFIVLADTPPAFADSFKDSANIYVPDASVTAYKEATNWSTYASIIKPLSQLATDNPTLYKEVEEYL